MDKQLADAAQFRAGQLARRVLEYVRLRESEFKQRDRFNRYPAQLPPREAVVAVLHDEQLDELTLELLIKELGRLGSAPLALALLDWLLEHHSPLVTKHTFDAALAVCCSQFRTREALRVHATMMQHGIAADLRSTNLALASCSHTGAVVEAMQLLEELVARGGAPNEFSVLMMLQTCAFKRRGRYKEAVRAVQMFRDAQQGASPHQQPQHHHLHQSLPREVLDGVLTVFEAAIHKADSLEAACGVFEELRGLGLAGSTRAYNALLRACARRGRHLEARSYFEDMAQAGVPANTSTYNSLIRACVAGSALDEALGIFEWLVSGRDVADPIPADIDTYNSLIRACHQAGHLEKALEIMAWVESSGVAFDETTYEELIGTVEIAEIWDNKAVRSAGENHLAMFPDHLRPAPHNSMRLLYLEHMAELEEEAVLAATKLGLPSWTSSLTRTLPTAQALGGSRGEGNHLVATAARAAAAAGAGGAAGAGVAGAPGAGLVLQPRKPGLMPSPLPLSRMPSFSKLSLDNLNTVGAVASESNTPRHKLSAQDREISLAGSAFGGRTGSPDAVIPSGSSSPLRTTRPRPTVALSVGPSQEGPTTTTLFSPSKASAVGGLLSPLHTRPASPRNSGGGASIAGAAALGGHMRPSVLAGSAAGTPTGARQLRVLPSLAAVVNSGGLTPAGSGALSGGGGLLAFVPS
eukprot:CAMPEP_0202892486 /NCGR_PEP_ID=MMETSP1392-20130828/2204_1 /ASSEMBLY_ACC=CAM_ASM_000868 /TAXON_ID=225041 /ORGANISM="Chlamydomonas chlamydogama, Strain SAG 11-48b" /LENGTH=693 /DNA_ID=CAMNT_0049576461 /DNA_START=248 /DNA_END=2329 /DNA_ORIENTATION=-